MEQYLYMTERKKNCQSRNPFLMKISFKNDDDIKTSDIQSQTNLSTAGPHYKKY